MDCSIAGGDLKYVRGRGRFSSARPRDRYYSGPGASGDVVSRDWHEVSTGRRRFSHVETRAQSLLEVSKQDLLKLVEDHLLSDSRRVLRTRVYAAGDDRDGTCDPEGWTVAPNAGSELRAWKERGGLLAGRRALGRGGVGAPADSSVHCCCSRVAHHSDRHASASPRAHRSSASTASSVLQDASPGCCAKTRSTSASEVQLVQFVQFDSGIDPCGGSTALGRRTKRCQSSCQSAALTSTAE